MQYRRFVSYIDTHTAGEPTRIILSGFPKPQGRTARERQQWLHDHAEPFRRFVIQEPRGHADMFAALVMEPVDPSCAAGVFFLESGGFLAMCGHGTIGVATALFSLGWASSEQFSIETPAGIVTCRLNRDAVSLKSVSFENVPAFFLEERVVEGIPMALSYGGNLFGLVHVEDVGEKIDLQHVDRLVEIAMRLRDRVNAQGPWPHPQTGRPLVVDLIEFYDEGNPPHNLVVFGNRQVDRSPCGTGTSAKMAYLHVCGRLGIDVPYVYRSVLDTEFVGRIVREVDVGDRAGIIPEITGAAYVSGMGSLVLVEGDPFPDGFTLR